MNSSKSDIVVRALDHFRIEIPSRGFANTGTRFGNFLQAAAATTTEEEFSDAGEVHSVTGICPTIALHVLWEFPQGLGSVLDIQRFSKRCGVNQDRLIQICSRARNTNMARSVIQTLPYESVRYNTPKTESRLYGYSIVATYRCGSPTDRAIRERRTSLFNQRVPFRIRP